MPQDLPGLPRAGRIAKRARACGTRTRTRYTTPMRGLLICLAAAMSFAQPAMREASVPREGFSLHYKILGAGRPLVLLSGGPGFDVDYMLPVAEALAPLYQCILLEQRGTGKSRPPDLTPASMNLAAVVEDVEALRANLRTDRLLILGHSWGGMLAMAYAAAHPDRVDALVLVASGGLDLSFAPVFEDNIAMHLWPEDRMAIEKATAAARSAKDPDRAAEEIILARSIGYFFDRGAAARFLAAYQRGSFHPGAANALMPDIMAHYNVRTALRGFNRPALIIQGHQDPIGESTAYEIHSALKNSRLVLLDKCGHFTWTEQPEPFYKAVREFLAGVAR